MKKTLITLAALAAAFTSTVSADTEWTSLGSISATNKNYQSESMDVYAVGNHTFTFTIPSDALTANNSTILAYINGGGIGGSNNKQITYMLTATEGEDNTTVYTLTMGRSNNTLDAASILWSSRAVSESLTSGTTYTVTTTGGDTSSAQVTANGGFLNTRTFDSQILFANDVTTLSSGFNSTFAVKTSEGGSGNIPEPTTATLSLLALAGLAARRRRK